MSVDFVVIILDFHYDMLIAVMNLYTNILLLELMRSKTIQCVLLNIRFSPTATFHTLIFYVIGYKFDETDHESYVLRLTFARHPGPRGPARDDSFRGGRERGDDYRPRGGGGGGRR